MIKYVKGDMFKSPAKILVNTVNTVGVMGKGVALEFKKQYPEMFYRYKKLCEEKQLDIGKLFLWRKEKNGFCFSLQKSIGVIHQKLNILKVD